MLKVKFENHGSGGVFVFGTPEIDIPGHAIGEKAVIVSMPETPKSEAVINDLKRRYPAMTVTIIDDEGGEAPLSVNVAGASEVEGGEVSAPAVLLSEDEFREKVKNVEKKNAGWCIVSVDGIPDPIKVRATGEDDPVAVAYAAYAAKAGE